MGVVASEMRPYQPFPDHGRLGEGDPTKRSPDHGRLGLARPRREI
jgi:hypothetical protein